jgi:protein MpaA
MTNAKKNSMRNSYGARNPKVLVHQSSQAFRNRLASKVAAAFVVLASSFSAYTANAYELSPKPLTIGYTPVQLISQNSIGKFIYESGAAKQAIKSYCDRLKSEFAKFEWDKDPCGEIEWQADLKSQSGHPLIYAAFGTGKETTLLLGGVHPDELTPIPIAFRMARYLRDNSHIWKDASRRRIIVAPLVNPDGFMRNIPSRTNANGVDVNRNFLTLDWYATAKELWRARQRNPKHFPGYFPNTEVETIFQIHLIDRFAPDKIMSIHAPLGFLDYDGPGDNKPVLQSKTEREAKQLVQSISEKSRNYRVVDYRFYPGSLGNYAGNERQIPTVTLELETTNPKKVEEYWKQFLPGILQSIDYPFTAPDATSAGNATRFSAEYKLPENDRG